MQLTRIIATNLNLEYIYPAANAGRIDRMKNHVSGEEVVYQYDSLARLTSATAQIGATPRWTQTYSYL